MHAQGCACLCVLLPACKSTLAIAHILFPCPAASSCSTADQLRRGPDVSIWGPVGGRLCRCFSGVQWRIPMNECRVLFRPGASDKRQKSTHIGPPERAMETRFMLPRALAEHMRVRTTARSKGAEREHMAIAAGPTCAVWTAAGRSGCCLPWRWGNMPRGQGPQNDLKRGGAHGVSALSVFGESARARAQDEHVCQEPATAAQHHGTTTMQDSHAHTAGSTEEGRRTHRKKSSLAEREREKKKRRPANRPMPPGPPAPADPPPSLCLSRTRRPSLFGSPHAPHPTPEPAPKAGLCGSLVHAVALLPRQSRVTRVWVGPLPPLLRAA